MLLSRGFRKLWCFQALGHDLPGDWMRHELPPRDRAAGRGPCPGATLCSVRALEAGYLLAESPVVCCSSQRALPVHCLWSGLPAPQGQGAPQACVVPSTPQSTNTAGAST